jgi:hypothetical protein
METVMKIKMLAGFSGADFSVSPNEETERFSDNEARRMIDAGYAVPVVEEKREKAAKSPAPEKRG